MSIIYTKHPPISGLGQDIKLISDVIKSINESEIKVIDVKYVYAMVDHKKDPLEIRKLIQSGNLKRIVFLEHLEPLLLNMITKEKSDAKVYFVPNFDFIDKTAVENLYYVDKLLCKTQNGMDIAKKMLAQIKVRKPDLYKRLKFTTHFISFTSILNNTNIRGRITEAPQKSFAELFPLPVDKPLENTIFFHPAGLSPYKNTADIIDIWLAKLTDEKRMKLLITRRTVIRNLDISFPRKTETVLRIPGSETGLQNYKNIYLVDYLPVPEYEYIMGLPNTICLIPSEIEGFGHVINQARTKAVVMTSDAPPMSEFLNCLDKKYRDLCLLKPDPLPFLDSRSTGIANRERKIGFSFMTSARFVTPKTREAFVKSLYKVAALPIAEREKIIEIQRADFERQATEFFKLAKKAFELI